MAGKVVIYTGAPTSSTLTWDPSILLSDFPEPIARFAGLPLAPPGLPSTTDSSRSLTHEYAVWRSLPLERTNLHSGFTQLHAVNQWVHSSPDFLTTAGDNSFMTEERDSASEEANNDLLSQFYEPSLAVHDQIPSSQLESIQEATSFQTDSLTSFDDTSFASTTAKDPIGNRLAGHLSDLEDIPSASYLLKSQPATVTVNLIVGIISLAPPRTIKTKWGNTSSLVKALVGDETKSGFAVTFWLPTGMAFEDSDLAGLRPQDVVLMQNVALNVFMKKVYGSSLRKGMTKVHLLYRRKLDRDDVGGYYRSGDLMTAKVANPQLDKTTRVWEWVLNFVGTGPAVPGKNGRQVQERAWDRPPPIDTQ